MHGCICSFLAKLCLWETHLACDKLADFTVLKLVSKKWKWWPELHPQNCRIFCCIPGKALWYYILWKGTNIVQLAFLNVYGVKEELQWRYWITVWWYWKWSMISLEYQNSTNILGVVTLNIKKALCKMSVKKCLHF